MKNEWGFGLKAFVVFLIIIFSAMIIMAVGDSFITNQLNKIEESVDKIILNEGYFRCEIRYKETIYKGLCNDKVINNFRDLIEGDYNLKLIEICGNTPYAYRIEICEGLK